MKPFIAVASALVFLSFDKLSNQEHLLNTMYTDTSHVGHVLDGSTTEWPDSAFQTDKETMIHYASDNNGEYLFLALRVPDFRTQMKLMRQGMTVFIDLKGKKKEGRGIEYPIKPEGAPPPIKMEPGADKKEVRAAMSIRMFAMKLFGFSDAEPVSQALQMPGSANIAFDWDSSDVLHIEYFIPLSMLDNINSLHQKTISVGWKINGVQMQNGSPNTVGVTSTSSIEGRPSGGGGGRGGRGAGPTMTSSLPSSPGPAGGAPATMNEQSFWTKYSFRF